MDMIPSSSFLLLKKLQCLVLAAACLRVPPAMCIICATALVVATCLLCLSYNLKPFSRVPLRVSQPNPTPIPSPALLPATNLSGPRSSKRPSSKRPELPPVVSAISPPSSEMRSLPQHRVPHKPPAPPPITPQPLTERSKQPFDAFLVLDVEATCFEGTDFNFPNEIIEFPVCLMRWKDRSEDSKASHLEVVEEFRSFVKPSWRPILSQFCTNLTGITQEQVDAAPSFPQVLQSLEKFLVRHGLINNKGERLVRFCWCSDGPFDVRDFVVKQCFISKIPMPIWMQGDIIDVRTSVTDWLHAQDPATYIEPLSPWPGSRRRTLNLPTQLDLLGLSPFEGRQHCGIDDTRNVARIIAELARRGLALYPNTAVHPNRRWQWMGKRGQILERWSYFPPSPPPAELYLQHQSVMPPPVVEAFPPLERSRNYYQHNRKRIYQHHVRTHPHIHVHAPPPPVAAAILAN